MFINFSRLHVRQSREFPKLDSLGSFQQFPELWVDVVCTETAHLTLSACFPLAENNHPMGLRLCELFLGLNLADSATCRSTQHCYNLIHFLELILSLEWKALEVTWARHIWKLPLAWRNRENQNYKVGAVLSGLHCPKMLSLPTQEESAASLLPICSCIFL